MAENAIKSATRVDVNNIVVTTDGATVTAVNPVPAPAPTPPVLAPRIYTFGIGPYCNHYFLKRLAAIGRGMNDVAFRPHAIQAVMERMLAAAALPMLSDVQIRVQVGGCTESVVVLCAGWGCCQCHWMRRPVCAAVALPVLSGATQTHAGWELLKLVSIAVRGSVECAGRGSCCQSHWCAGQYVQLQHCRDAPCHGLFMCDVLRDALAAVLLPPPQGLTQVELYPFPIPDVFVGQPLLVSGKFEGDWPETVEICGTLPDGNCEWGRVQGCGGGFGLG